MKATRFRVKNRRDLADDVLKHAETVTPDLTAATKMSALLGETTKQGTNSALII